MDHEKILWDYIEGNLSQTEAEKIKLLLQKNDEFRREYSEIRNLHIALKDMKKIELPPNSATEILGFIKQKSVTKRKFYPSKTIIRIVTLTLFGILFSLVFYALKQSNLIAHNTYFSSVDLLKFKQIIYLLFVSVFSLFLCVWINVINDKQKQ